MKHTRAIKWLWIGGVPIVWCILALIVYHGVWLTGLLPENPSGLPTLLGHELSFWVCGPFPVAWIVVIVLAVKGRLPGTRRRVQGVCDSCGYDLAGLPTSTCPECGGTIRKGATPKA